MLKRILIAAASALTFVAVTPSLHASSEYVYVESNIQAANGNSIYAFKRQPDGSLQPIPGSPFLTGGAGTQDLSLKVGPPDSDQNIVASHDSNFLFAVNSGSDSIAVFHIGSDGALTPIEGSPFPSGGTNPVSLALYGNLLFVVNKNGDFARPSSIPPNYTSFRVQNNGSLLRNQTPGSTLEVALGSSPTQAFISPQKKVIYGADFLGGLLQSIAFDDSGLLTPFPAQALPASEFAGSAAPRLPLGLWAHPHQPYLYTGFVTINRLGVYQFTANGRIRFVRSVPNSGAAICWLRTNAAGTRLYSSDTISNSITVYDTTDAASPVETQNLVLEGPGNALEFSLSTDDKYLYAISSRGQASIPEGQGNALHVLQIAADGSVTETANSPILLNVPNGTRPQGVLAINK